MGIRTPRRLPRMWTPMAGSTLEKSAEENGHEGDMKALCGNPKVKEFIMEEMKKTSKEFKLKGFECAKNIHLEAEPFSPENELLTPTFKPKRPQLKNHYIVLINQMYAELEKK